MNTPTEQRRTPTAPVWNPVAMVLIGSETAFLSTWSREATHDHRKEGFAATLWVVFLQVAIINGNERNATEMHDCARRRPSRDSRIPLLHFY